MSSNAQVITSSISRKVSYICDNALLNEPHDIMLFYTNIMIAVMAVNLHVWRVVENRENLKLLSCPSATKETSCAAITVKGLMYVCMYIFILLPSSLFLFAYTIFSALLERISDNSIDFEHVCCLEYFANNFTFGLVINIYEIKLYEKLIFFHIFEDNTFSKYITFLFTLFC